MKNFLFCILLFIGGSVMSQTLTQTFNEPKVSNIDKSVALDTSGYTTGMPLGITGAGSNWDFSKLKTASDNFITSYVAPSTVTSSASYTGCTVVQKDSGLVTFIKSVTTPTTRTEVLGFTNPAFAATFTNSAIVAVYPISLASSFTDNIAGTITYSTTNLTCSGKISYTADGTGTLTLADGFKYNNVIRVKTVQTLTATLFFVPFATIARTQYQYFDASERAPVLSISYDAITLSGNTPSVTGSVSGNSKSFTGIEDYYSDSPLLAFYPNPASGQLNFTNAASLNGVVEIGIYDISGQLIKTEKKDASELKNMDISSFSAGCYILNVRYGQKQTMNKLLIE